MRRGKVIVFTSFAIALIMSAQCKTPQAASGDTDIIKQNTEAIMIFDKEPVCGGKRSDERQMKPLTEVKGDITRLSFFFYNSNYYHDQTPVSSRLDVADSQLSAELCSDRDHRAYKFETVMSASIADSLKYHLRESGLMAMNGWCVETNGLPFTTDCSLSITFSTGESYYMSFNGGDCPPDFDSAISSFVSYLISLTDYDPSKCELIPPYVSPFLGKHVFVYQHDGGMQKFIVNVENDTGTDNVEVVTEGDFENEHLRANGSKVHGTREQYYISIRNYYPDTREQNSTPNSLAMIVYRKNGKLFMEPLQMGKNLPEKVDIEEVGQ